MQVRNAVLILAAAAGLTGSAYAEGVAVTPNLGLLSGFGADVTYRLSPRFNVRAGASIPASATGEDIKFGDVKYDIKMKIGGLNALLDWHPFAGNLHVSGGLITVRDPWTLDATSVSSYKINGNTYTAADVGALTGEIDFGNAIAPTVLVGWGNSVRPGKRWGVVVDLGLAYLGKQDFRLSASGPIAGDPGFQRDFKEEQRLHSANASFMPILKFGVSYQF